MGRRDLRGGHPGVILKGMARPDDDAFWIAVVPPIMAAGIVGGFALWPSTFFAISGVLLMTLAGPVNLVTMVYLVTVKKGKPYRDLILLFLNWPAAILACSAVVMIAGATDIVVNNHSGRDLSSVRLRTPRRVREIGPLPRGASVLKRRRFKGSGAVTLEFDLDGPKSCPVLDYVAAGVSGGRAELDIDPKGGCRRKLGER
jgi:hypothetical protein